LALRAGKPGLVVPAGGPTMRYNSITCGGGGDQAVGEASSAPARKISGEVLFPGDLNAWMAFRT
jgi:hypothetical protein